jgi:hypothetical protein
VGLSRFGSIATCLLIGGCGWDQASPYTQKEPDVDWMELERTAITLFDISCHENGSEMLQQLYQTPDQDAYVRILPHHHRYLLLVDLLSGHQAVFLSGANIKHPLDLVLGYIAPVVSKNSNARLWQTSPTRQSSYGLANKLAILEPPRSDRRDRVTLVTANESSCIAIVILEHAPKPFTTCDITIQVSYLS